jgi:Gas vesicle synthesis protein GvpL/GvpF
MGYGLYLYGIFPAPGPENVQLEGLDQQPVQVHLLNDFAFLYSAAQKNRYLASRRNLLKHEDVLEAVMHQGYRTLLPLQFGSIVSSWESVLSDLITPSSSQLKELFAKLAGKREVGIKILWETNAELQQMLAENQPLKAKRDRLEGKQLSMEQVISIGQEIERSLQERKDGIIQEFQKILNPLAIEMVENDLLTEAMIYNAAYLISWDSEAEFGSQVELLDRQFDGRLRIRYNNFTAPYNFAQLNPNG